MVRDTELELAVEGEREMRGRTATICTQAGLQTSPGKDLKMGSKGGKCRDIKKSWK